MSSNDPQNIRKKLNLSSLSPKKIKQFNNSPNNKENHSNNIDSSSTVDQDYYKIIKTKIENEIASAKSKNAITNYISTKKQNVEESNISLSPTTVEMHNLKIYFPFMPYDSQKKVASTIIEAALKNKMALIESPTGTGKSLAIWAAITALHNKFPETKFFIASRTHTQLSQLVKNLKLLNSINQSSIKAMTVYASRKIMCISEKLVTIKDKNNGCREMVNKGQCKQFMNREALANKFTGRIFDIEEIVRSGRSNNACPYYTSIILGDRCRVVLLPYNYIFDRQIRESMKISINNAICIIDEGHNVEDVCRQSGSLVLTKMLVEMVSAELRNINLKSAIESKEDIGFFLKLFYGITKYVNKWGRTAEVKLKRGFEIIKELELMEINKETVTKMTEICKSNRFTDLIGFGTLSTIEKLIYIFVNLFNKSSSYGFTFTGGKEYSINFYLLDPSVVFNDFTACKSISLLSGTLEPFANIASELNKQFIMESADHVISDDQIFVATIQDENLKGIYNIVETQNYMKRICNLINEASKNIAGGTLVFVPNYSILRRIKEHFGNNSKIFYESQKNEEFTKIILSYKKTVSNTNASTILVCVFRGKASEGIDFADDLARLVIAIGIPMSNIKDPVIKMKRDFNDSFKNGTGAKWYESQAFTAVNQAIGRVIRHKSDHGAVILLDDRYRAPKNVKMLTKWIRSRLQVFKNEKEIIEKLKIFSDKNLNRK